MEPLGYKPSNFNTFAAVMIGYLVNTGVPRLGEVVKCTILARYEKVRADRLVGTIVMERAVDVVCLVIVFIFALIFQGGFIGEHVAANFTDFFHDNTGHTKKTPSPRKNRYWSMVTIGFFIQFPKIRQLAIGNFQLTFA